MAVFCPICGRIILPNSDRVAFADDPTVEYHPRCVERKGLGTVLDVLRQNLQPEPEPEPEPEKATEATEETETETVSE